MAIHVGSKVIAHVPIQLSEDEAWPIGTEVEVVAVSEDGQGIELQAADDSIGSFAPCDIEGEYAWFHKA